jgi:ribosomal protein S18
MASIRRPALPPISKSSCDDHWPEYKDLDHLRKFLTAHGQILSRKRTGYCTQCQKALKLAIKRARHLGMLPFVG